MSRRNHLARMFWSERRLPAGFKGSDRPKLVSNRLSSSLAFGALRESAGVGFQRFFLSLLLFAFIFSASAEQRIYRILPVGDSITEGGKTFSNYRYPLWEKLFAAGYLVEFVGSRTSESRVGPLRHEGYGGRERRVSGGRLQAQLLPRTRPTSC